MHEPRVFQPQLIVVLCQSMSDSAHSVVGISGRFRHAPLLCAIYCSRRVFATAYGLLTMSFSCFVHCFGVWPFARWCPATSCRVRFDRHRLLGRLERLPVAVEAITLRRALSPRVWTDKRDF